MKERSHRITAYVLAIRSNMKRLQLPRHSLFIDIFSRAKAMVRLASKCALCSNMTGMLCLS